MRTRLSTHALLAVALLFSAVAGATTIIPAADPGELALDSQAVFLARAGASTVERRSGYLSTVTALEVLSVVKGNMESGDRVEVVAPGGEKNGSGWAVAGSPRLAEGEVYLFFADRGRDGQWQPRLLADSVLQRASRERRFRDPRAGAGIDPDRTHVRVRPQRCPGAGAGGRKSIPRRAGSPESRVNRGGTGARCWRRSRTGATSPSQCRRAACS